jgi:hypothetical protein
MITAELSGKHLHETDRGNVGIYLRNGVYLARGRLNRQAFGQQLGKDCDAAERSLRRLLVEIDDGTYQRSSDVADRSLRQPRAVNLTIRQLCDDFVAEKRKTKGQKTASDYRCRLMPVLDFFEEGRALTKWPIAASISRDAIIDLKSFLMKRQVTRNGRVGGQPRPMSPRQIRNCL